MARRSFKAWWTKIVPGPVERSTYVLVATLLLALLCWQWRAMPGEVWNVTDPTGVLIIQIVFFLGWGILLAATFMIDHFDLFGLRQVFLFATGKPYTEREFMTRGFYSYLRHPIMFGFIVAFWAAPVMSVGHLVFSIATTAYIFIGIAFEERDLLVSLGEPYRAYRMRVSMILPMPSKKSGGEVGSETTK
jgi:protein-S-isoprenylcysteine O-methyltransferase Ste14